MAGDVILERPDAFVARLVLNQPGKKNAIDATMREALGAKVRALSTDPTARAIVITGADGNFSSGGDLQSLRATQPDQYRGRLEAGHALIRSLYTFPKPVMIALEGVAAGGGAGIALCGDLIVMAASARFSFGFLRVGLIPDWGLAHTVQERAGGAAVSRLLLGARSVGAPEAVALGLADEDVADDDVQTVALERAREFASKIAPIAFARAKSLTRSADRLDAALAKELELQADCLSGPEFREGASAFLQKRSPDFFRQAGEINGL